MIVKHRIADCFLCGRVREVDGSGLCNSRCSKWSQRRKGDPDHDYLVWLLQSRNWDSVALPHSMLGPMVERAVEKFGTLAETAERVGVSGRRLYAVLHGSNGSYKMGYGLARVLDCVEWFESQACQIGRTGWSDIGTYCGENSSLAGCGTYFHEHYARGVCRECYHREVLGTGPSEPRDVRVAAMRGRVVA